MEWTPAIAMMITFRSGAHAREDDVLALIRATQSEEIRRRAIGYAEEVLAGISADLKRPIAVSAEWV